MDSTDCPFHYLQPFALAIKSKRSCRRNEILRPGCAPQSVDACLGPAGLDYAGSGTPNMGPAAGRTTAFVIDPTNASTMYAGFALGGVWKSTDAGASWTALTDSQPSLAVGAMVLDATNPQTIYV